MFTSKTEVILVPVASALVPPTQVVLLHLSTSATCSNAAINNKRRYKEKLASCKSDCKVDEKKDGDI
jgi:hypothetical protein